MLTIFGTSARKARKSLVDEKISESGPGPGPGLGWPGAGPHPHGVVVCPVRSGVDGLIFSSYLGSFEYLKKLL